MFSEMSAGERKVVIDSITKNENIKWLVSPSHITGLFLYPLENIRKVMVAEFHSITTRILEN